MNKDTTPSDQSEYDSRAQQQLDAENRYQPVFSDKVRTGVYIACLALVVVGAGFGSFGNPAIGDYLTTIGGVLASGFGVVYNPIRLSGKTGSNI